MTSNLMELLERDLDFKIIEAKSQVTFREYILNEAKQVGIVYHFTSLLALHSILVSNRLDISSKNSSVPFLSLTRDFQLPDNPGSYFSLSDVRFSLDGNKISNNIKILPFQEEGYKDESEEVVFKSLKVSKYVIQIDVKVPKMSFIDTTKIIDLGKKYNIKINIVPKWIPYKD